MNQACHEFRAVLVTALEQRRALAELSLDAHLSICGDCRALLEEERALDVLLAEWPTPKFGDERVARLLQRLARERSDEHAWRALDVLLERATPIHTPADLSSRVLRGLSAERARAAAAPDALDHVLEALPAPVAPAGLASRVLRGLAHARADERDRVQPELRVRLLRAWKPLAAAAALVVSLSLWGAWRWRSATLSKQPPQGLLAELELLESIELLQGSDIDVLLSELPDDEVELLQAASEAEQAAPAAATEGKRSNG